MRTKYKTYLAIIIGLLAIAVAVLFTLWTRIGSMAIVDDDMRLLFAKYLESDLLNHENSSSGGDEVIATMSNVLERLSPVVHCVRSNNTMGSDPDSPLFLLLPTKGRPWVGVLCKSGQRVLVPSNKADLSIPSYRIMELTKGSNVTLITSTLFENKVMVESIDCFIESIHNATHKGLRRVSHEDKGAPKGSDLKN